MNRQRLVRPYMWAFVVAGACVVLYCAANMPLSRLDLRLVPLVVVLLVVSRFHIPIPRTSGVITFTDMFIFVAALLYGGEVAVLLAAAGNFVGSPLASRRGKRPFSLFTSLFNAANMACSTLVTVWVLRNVFGSGAGPTHGG